MAETPYITDPKDMRDLNQNVLLLIQKVNHEQTDMNKEIKATNVRVSSIEKNMKYIKQLLENFKGASVAIKIIAGFIAVVGTLIGIGAAVSGFN